MDSNLFKTLSDSCLVYFIFHLEKSIFIRKIIFNQSAHSKSHVLSFKEIEIFMTRS